MDDSGAPPDARLGSRPCLPVKAASAPLGGISGLRASPQRAAWLLRSAADWGSPRDANQPSKRQAMGRGDSGSTGYPLRTRWAQMTAWTPAAVGGKGVVLQIKVLAPNLEARCVASGAFEEKPGSGCGNSGPTPEMDAN